MKLNNTIVVLLGIGALSPFIGFAAAILGLGFLVSICKTLFGVTWLFMLVHVLTQRQMEASSKVGWFAGIFLFGFLVGPFYWHSHIREAQKWSMLAR